jgi:hypothetical protein
MGANPKPNQIMTLATDPPDDFTGWKTSTKDEFRQKHSKNGTVFTIKIKKRVEGKAEF